MLNKLRNFSKGKMAAVLVAIIIVPFVFWGMGSVFSGGSTNSVAKLNNHNISTKDFVEFINKSKINPELIRDNESGLLVKNGDDKKIIEYITKFLNDSIFAREMAETGYNMMKQNYSWKTIADNFLVILKKNGYVK